MSDFLLAMLIALALLVLAFPVLRWAVKAERRAEDQLVMDRVYYPTRGRQAAYQRNDEWLIDLDVDEWDDQT